MATLYRWVYKVGEVMGLIPVQRNALEVLKERRREMIQAALPAISLP